MDLLQSLLLTLLLLWLVLVWSPALTRSLWLAGLLARETAHLAALLALLWLILGDRSTAPDWFSPAVVVLGLLLAWPLGQSLASPETHPDYSGWPPIAVDSPVNRSGSWSWGLRRRRLTGAILPFWRVVTVTHHCYRSEPLPLYLDHYRSVSTQDSARSWLLVIHGGGWSGGSRREAGGFNRALARMGVDVLAVDYRLAPAWRYPAPLEDLRAALAFIRREASRLGLDPAAGHVLGRSAGGQLALQLAYGPDGSGLRLVIAVYAPADMVFAGTAPFNRRLLDARATLVDYLGGTWAAYPERYAAASPLLAVRPGLPPTLLVHGVDDALVGSEHTRRLATALRAAQVPVATAVLPWMQHGGDVPGVGPSAWFCFNAVVTAIARVSPTAFESARRK